MAQLNSAPHLFVEASFACHQVLRVVEGCALGQMSMPHVQRWMGILRFVVQEVPHSP